MLVKNIPPVPEGFDPDSVQFGVPPSKGSIARLLVGANSNQYWQVYKRYSWDFQHIFCLPSSRGTPRRGMTPTGTCCLMCMSMSAQQGMTPTLSSNLRLPESGASPDRLSGINNH